MIERIYIRSTSGSSQLAQDSVVAVANSGIEGDRNFARHDYPGQNITLIEAEEIEAFSREYARLPDLAMTYRNLVTRGVRLNALVGKEFSVGSVRLKGVELCEPCLHLGTLLASAELTPAAVVKRFLHRAGLRADILSNGLIKRGAAVTIDA